MGWIFLVDASPRIYADYSPVHLEKDHCMAGMKVTGTVVVTTLAAALFMSGCNRKAQAITEVQNKLAPIENAMADEINEGKSTQDQADAVKMAVQKMEAIDTSKCPEDYRAVLNELLQVWKNLQKAYEETDQEAVTRLFDQWRLKANRLNEIAKSHGIRISPSK